MTLQSILDILFSTEEQAQLESEIKEYVRSRIKPSTEIQEDLVVAKRRRKSNMSPENRLAAAERMRAMVTARREAKKEKHSLSGTEIQILRAVKNGAHWPSEVSSNVGLGWGVTRMTNMMHSLESAGYLFCPREGVKAFFEITENGKVMVEENSVQPLEPVEQ